jgi:hypothetical protein
MLEWLLAATYKLMDYSRLARMAITVDVRLTDDIEVGILVVPPGVEKSITRPRGIIVSRDEPLAVVKFRSGSSNEIAALLVTSDSIYVIDCTPPRLRKRRASAKTISPRYDASRLLRDPAVQLVVASIVGNGVKVRNVGVNVSRVNEGERYELTAECEAGTVYLDGRWHASSSQYAPRYFREAHVMISEEVSGDGRYRRLRLDGGCHSASLSIDMHPILAEKTYTIWAVVALLPIFSEAKPCKLRGRDATKLIDDALDCLLGDTARAIQQNAIDAQNLQMMTAYIAPINECNEMLALVRQAIDQLLKR